MNYPIYGQNRNKRWIIKIRFYFTKLKSFSNRIIFLLDFQVKYRTLRIGIANVFYSVAVPIGTALSGVLLRGLGFYGVYIIAIAMYTFTITYGVIFIKETKPETCFESKEQPKPTSRFYLIEDFFSLSNIKEAISVTFKEGQHNRKLRIISLLVVVIVVMGPLYGS